MGKAFDARCSPRGPWRRCVALAVLGSSLTGACLAPAPGEEAVGEGDGGPLPGNDPDGGRSGAMTGDVTRPGAGGLAGTLDMRPADAALADARPTEAGTAPQGGGVPLYVASGAGQIFTYDFDTASGVAVFRALLDLGAPIQAVTARPGSDLLVVATQARGAEMATLNVVRWPVSGPPMKVSESPAGKKDVSRLLVDRSGRWLVYAAEGGFRAAPLAADGAIGASQSMHACHARGLAFDEPQSALFATCQYDGTVHRFDFSQQAGPAMPRLHLRVNTGPFAIDRLGTNLVVAGGAANAPTGSNVLTLVGPTAAGELARATLRPPALGSMARPYGTGLAIHPRLPVAYVLNGASYQYSGEHLAVVAVTGTAIEVRQYVDTFKSSRLVQVSPDGRWLFVGSGQVNDVRAWAIDFETGKLASPKVLGIVEAPVGLGFR